VLVLQGCGPKGYPGMSEDGNLPIAAKLVEQRVRDTARELDAPMSGTAFGTVVLHVAPAAQSTVRWPGSKPATAIAYKPAKAN